MRIIDRLLLRAIVPPFLISATVLTFVVFVREIGKLSELLITRNASLEVIGIIAATVLPGILIFSLPMSFLIGTLIGLSGLAGESQMTALRACGVPLVRMLRPILTLAAMVGLVTAVFTLFILPSSNDTLEYLKDRISLRQATGQIQPRVFNEQFPNVVFYLDDIAIDRQRWSRVFLADNTDPKSPRIVLAQRGGWVTDLGAYRVQLHLEDGVIHESNPEDASKDNVSVFTATDIPIELGHASARAPNAETPARPRKPPEISSLDLLRGAPAAPPSEQRARRIELHQRLTLPFSVLAFSLIGLIFGASTRKGGRSSGFILSFVLVLTFYTLYMGGIRLASVEKLPIWLGVWGANVLLLGAGLLLLGTAERHHWLGARLEKWPWRKRLEPIGRQLHLDAARSGIRKLDDVLVSSTTQIVRFRFPKILDLYVGKSFCLYFTWSMAVCGALFIVLTLFDLLDDIIRNRIPILFVIDYFVFLVPQILLVVIPMSILLAILINFGVLEKSSQVTALKAGGWSLYRISMPVFILAGILCLGLYLMQDYVLPYSNMRQDSLRNVIKGRPVQTSMRPQRKWIFGESNRIFNYEYFDPSQRMFLGLNVYEVDLQGLKILRRIKANRAHLGNDDRWVLENGWVRDFRSGSEAFRLISRESFAFPEKASYFQKEIFEPRESSKLTYLELKDYIDYLRKSGYNATELQVELYKKLSFPLSCVVMAMLGVPFSFSMGRKGAFFGITVSIAVAIIYWGVYSVFEQMGVYGLLVPLLAAWAPNVLFGAAGLALLFTIRS